MPKEIIKQCEDKMMKTVESLKKEFTKIRTGKANPSVLNGIMVEYYGSPMPINQIASVSAPEPQMIVIKPYDKSILKDIEHAINMSDVGINPTNDGKVIRLVFPELTEESRKELAKDVKKKGDAAKTAVRNIRRDGNDAFKKSNKAKEISEDEYAELQEKLQKITDKYVAMVDKAVEAKTKEIMTV